MGSKYTPRRPDKRLKSAEQKAESAARRRKYQREWQRANRARKVK